MRDSQGSLDPAVQPTHACDTFVGAAGLRDSLTRCPAGAGVLEQSCGNTALGHSHHPLSSKALGGGLHLI